VNIGVERLFGVGHRAGGAWLLRGLGSWERGGQFPQGVQRERFTSVYGDAAYFLGTVREQLYQGEVRHGVSVVPRNGWLLTPYVLGSGRYLTGSSPWASRVVEGGAGMSLKVMNRNSSRAALVSVIEMRGDYRARLVNSSSTTRARGWTLTTIVHF
jgi:hypothetical protein